MVDLNHLHNCELMIADEIKRICEKHEIRYFVITGTLLGAVRHKGFIPWDDDMDFGMLRPDYDKFCKVCKNELKSDFLFEDWNTDNDYPFSFGKVRLKGTKIEERFAPKKKKNQFIFVDVFPFDNAPNDIIKQKKQAKRIFYLRRVLWVKKGYGRCIKEEGIKQRIKYDLSRFCFALLPYSYIKNRLYSELIKYNNDKCHCAFMDSIYSYEKNKIKKRWANSLSTYSFDGHEYKGFSEYHNYLTHLYNDYMKLPPENKRHNHDILSVDFGDY